MALGQPAQQTVLTRFLVSLRIAGQLVRLSVSLRIGLYSHASRSVKVKEFSAPIDIKMKTRGVT